MTRRHASCPNCSAPVEFLWSGSVQIVCPNCRSVIVRHDVNLEALGTVADLPPDPSPIRIGTTGRFGRRPFRAIGRILYEHEAGGWNEWHLLFDDGGTGWLSDAQGEYAVSRQVPSPGDLPPRERVRLGDRFAWHGQELTVSTFTRARYRGVEGELPFETWNRELADFVDLRSPGADFATIDYTEDPPLVFLGRTAAFDDLALRDLREPSAVGVGGTRGLNCANCGAPIELRIGAQALTAVCGHCLAVLDPSDPSLAIVQEAARRTAHSPKVPLGARGKLRDVSYQVIGFQVRSITVDDETYSWDEYVLHHREQGFRYLSEYQGHWNDIKALSTLPRMTSARGRPAARLLGETFRHFQQATATTRFVLGEFPWRVRVGDEAIVDDYVSPPRMLSAERTGDEVTWSLGEYTTGEHIWHAFGLPGRPPRPVGVFANQPSPHRGRAGRAWAVFAILAALLLLVAAGRFVLASRDPVFSGEYSFSAQQGGEAAFVTPVFEVGGGTSNVEVAIDTDLVNDWLYLSLALVDGERGTALDFGREVSFYSGRDGDESWTEGARRERAKIPAIPPGRYYLRVEPEGAPSGRPVIYALRVRRDVPSLLPFAIALVLLAIPPLFTSLRAASFEGRRWQESDHSG